MPIIFVAIVIGTSMTGNVKNDLSKGMIQDLAQKVSNINTNTGGGRKRKD